MKLVAQRVTHPVTRAQGINAFHYAHGSVIWNGPPPSELGHGTLHASQVGLAPGGNRVLTYLDIVTPDETPTATLLQAFAQVYSCTAPPPFATTIGNCTFESNMVPVFRRGCRQELVHLFNAAITTRSTMYASALP